MPLPRLIHPVPTDVRQIDKTETIYDEGYREPVQQAERGVTKTVPGQWKWGSDKELRPGKSGPEEESDGYVLFRLIDLEGQGINPLQIQDQIVGYGGGRGRVNLDVYIISLRYIGHYSDQAGPSMVKAFFKDRQPSRQTRGG